MISPVPWERADPSSGSTHSASSQPSDRADLCRRKDCAERSRSWWREHCNSKRPIAMKLVVSAAVILLFASGTTFAAVAGKRATNGVSREPALTVPPDSLLAIPEEVGSLQASPAAAEGSVTKLETRVPGARAKDHEKVYVCGDWEALQPTVRPTLGMTKSGFVGDAWIAPRPSASHSAADHVRRCDWR